MPWQRPGPLSPKLASWLLRLLAGTLRRKLLVRPEPLGQGGPLSSKTPARMVTRALCCPPYRQARANNQEVWNFHGRTFLISNNELELQCGQICGQFFRRVLSRRKCTPRGTSLEDSPSPPHRFPFRGRVQHRPKRAHTSEFRCRWWCGAFLAFTRRRFWMLVCFWLKDTWCSSKS